MPERRIPDAVTVKTAVAAAVRAPSARNTQPWSWRIGYRTLHLFADPHRHSPTTDADERDTVLSCGAALHHLRVAFAALGWATDVDRIPDPAQPDHLAVVTPHPSDPTANELTLAAAILQRRSDRRTHTGPALSPWYLDTLAATVAKEGAQLKMARSAALRHLAEAIETAWADPPSERVTPRPVVALSSDVAGAAAGTRLSARTERDNAVLLVLSTPGDDRRSRLRAGEATSAALLAATALGLASCALTQPLRNAATRSEVSARVTGSLCPQVLLRLGWAPLTAAALPQTSRRALTDVLQPLEAPPC
ncbi:NAD(P)H nitroreductase [Amycolatopsis sp. DSM 110486]|uniref:NAD(P)H nitroreductase n=1 Tax=Amycolatopsis sp. DSM 110486 TaxID=2865832 RepID=UPI001C6A0C81|nr:NAD(P)H nitroreductase [Amycolatopsis sp. DSM 110486]QYN18746.1 NAD(P)H nitroreductase [Amycolatopsis sp. DSM 110486]